MVERYVMSIDQGTTSTRCILFDARAARVGRPAGAPAALPAAGLGRARRRRDLAQPRSAWCREALRRRRDQPPDQIAAVGIANQRETTVVWDRAHRRPGGQRDRLAGHPHRRAGRASSDAGPGPRFFRPRAACRSPTYFSGPDRAGCWTTSTGCGERAERGEVLFGTMESWLIWNLTGGAAALHLTDVTNASRTMLMNIRTLDWDHGAAGVLRHPARHAARRSAPRPRSTAAARSASRASGSRPRSATSRRRCSARPASRPGEAKCTYGTGSFLLLNTGTDLVRSRTGCSPPSATRSADAARGLRPGRLDRGHRLAGAVVPRPARPDRTARRRSRPWPAPSRTTAAATSCPAFSGLFAPHWRSDARGVIVGLTSYITKGHLARAVLEATGWQTREVVDAMNADSGLALKTLKVDGGMTSDNLLMQFLADVLDVPVVRPMVAETVSLGAAYAAGLAVGYWPDLEGLRRNWHRAAQWLPDMDPAVRRGVRELAARGRALARLDRAAEPALTARLPGSGARSNRWRSGTEQPPARLLLRGPSAMRLRTYFPVRARVRTC